VSSPHRHESYEGVYEVADASSPLFAFPVKVGDVRRESDLSFDTQEMLQAGAIRLIGFVRREPKLYAA